MSAASLPSGSTTVDAATATAYASWQARAPRARRIAATLGGLTTVNQVQDHTDDAKFLHTWASETPGRWERFLQNDIFYDDVREALRAIVKP